MADATITRAADASLTDEQQHFVSALRDYCEREFPEQRLKELTNDYEDIHIHSVAEQMAELGWYGLTIDEEYGGSGGTFLDAALFLEETARGRVPIGGYAVTLIVVGALNKFGTDDQKRDLLGRVSKGGALAIMWRQLRMLRLADGPDEVHKMVIAMREMNRWANDPSTEGYGGPAEVAQPAAAVGAGDAGTT